MESCILFTQKCHFLLTKSYWESLLLTDFSSLDFRPPFIKNTSVLFFQYQDLDTFWQQTQSILQPMILIFSFYATNFRFHFHPLHYLHFAPIMNAFSFYFPPFLAFLNAERNMILSVRISQEFLSQIKSSPWIRWFTILLGSQKEKNRSSMSNKIHSARRTYSRLSFTY